MTQEAQILENANSTKDMKLMVIVKLLAEQKISKITAYNMLEEYGLFNEDWVMVDADCGDLLEKLALDK